MAHRYSPPGLSGPSVYRRMGDALILNSSSNRGLIIDESQEEEAKQHSGSEQREEHKEDPSGEVAPAKKEEKSIIDLLNLPSCLHSRTSKCKHRHGCFENALRGMYRIFWFTFALKTVLGNVLLIIKPTKLIKSL